MKIQYAIILFLILGISSCTENFEDFNTDKKNPATTSGEALFTSAQKSLADQMNTPNVNRNIFELWAQYWNETTYTDETNYDIVERGQAEEVFRHYYRDVLKDLDEAERLINEEEPVNDEAAIMQNNKLQIIEILKVFAFQQLVDIFGAIPYSEALDINNVYPSYEMGREIYTDLLARLDAVLAEMNPSAGSFGSADLIYNGDVDKWIRFANTEKLKLGIHLADVDPSTSQSIVEEAVNDGVFTSREDEALFPYQSNAPNYNPIHAELVVTGRKDFVPANTMVDIMKDLNDPRMDDYFDPASTQLVRFPRDPQTGNMLDLVYEEGENTVLFYPDGSGGFDRQFVEGPFTIPASDSAAGIRTYLGGQYGATSLYGDHTHVNPEIISPTFPGLIMTYSQVLFYLAEAAARGHSVGITAEEAYNAAITESITWWGNSQEAADEYLAFEEVAWATAAGDWRRKIAYQSWIASYVNGFLGWTTWRRLDYPVLNITPTNPDIEEVTDIPVRFTFPVNEQTLNDANYAEAAEAIGGDDLTTKIFWDMFDAKGE